MKPNVVSISDLSLEDIEWIIDRAILLKKERKDALFRYRDELKGKIIGMIFEKPSTRTRVSFEVAIRELGGETIYMSWKEMQLGRGERIEETARVLSSYLDGIIIRASRHSSVEEFARYASIPVINGLTDLEHPCQTIADLMTIREKKGRRHVKVAWVGDGNNVCNSLIIGCAILGIDISVATPAGYEPDERIIEIGKKEAEKRKKSRIIVTNNKEEAVRDADVLYTDVWVSMGEEDKREEKMRALSTFQVDMNLLRMAKEDAIVMHCLPAHIGEEITEEVMKSSNSVIFEQAENRLHAQKALLMRIFSN